MWGRADQMPRGTPFGTTLSSRMATPLLAGAVARVPSPDATPGASTFEPKRDTVSAASCTPPGLSGQLPQCHAPTECLRDMTARFAHSSSPKSSSKASPRCAAVTAST